MRVKNKDNNVEYCTYCSKEWTVSATYPQCCNSCLCPATYCTAVEDVGWHSLSKEALGEIKELIEEQISRAIPPMTWEELCEKQPEANRIFSPKKKEEKADKKHIVSNFVINVGSDKESK